MTGQRDREKRIKRIRHEIKLFLTVCTFLLVSMSMFHITAFASEGIIRVGYIDMCGFTENVDGTHTGYAVEYLEEMAEYTGWKYEFVNDTWENCLQMLETGEIHLVCMAHYDDNRAEKYVYSEIPFGYEYTILYTAADSDIYYEDFAAMSGCRVGLMSQSKHSEEFITYAEKHNLTYEPVYYGTEEEVVAALELGSVDLAAVGSLHSHDELKMVGRFGVGAYYCVTGKENAALMDEINSVMQQIKLEYPEIENELHAKYYANNKISCSPIFTREEHEYIQAAEPITIKLMLETRPLGYEIDGEPAGIFTEYVNLISEASGLEFVIEETTSMDFDELTKQMVEEDYLTLRAKRIIDAIGLGDQLISSVPLIETQLSYVKLREKAEITEKADYTFALTSEMSYLPPMLQKASAEYEIIFYEDAKGCLEAVLDGKADIAIQDSYVVEYLLNKPEYAQKLVECPGQEVVNSMCLIAPQSMDTLVQIINKTIQYISDEEIANAISREMLLNPYKKTVGDYIYLYWNWFLLIGVILITAFYIYTLLLRRMTALQVRKREYVKLQRKVRQDELTGVYNRSHFFKAAREMIDSTDEKMCIVLMDISNFKVVNDLHGIEKGDQLLRYMAEELKKLGKNRKFIVSRFTGDHFYICTTEKDFYEIQFPKRFRTFLEDMDITVTYGVFMVGEQRNVPVNIMCDRASLAAHNMERKRVEYIRYYSEEDRKKIIEEQEISNEMEKALSGNQFCTYVQPKYDIEEGTIVGGEALVRWKHPQKGMIPPGVFISVFEKNGFIIRLDYFVWEETCRLIAEMKKKGVYECPISINVSRAHFYGMELQDKLEELIGKYQLQPQDLELEITETICAEDPDIIYKKIHGLQEAGFKVAMDDFGSGYSSLNMLKEMPLDIIKMDLKFLDGGENERRSRYILQTLIKLAQRMRLHVVVEGVETKEQVEFLKGIGKCHAQGYYYSRPIPTEEFMEKVVS